MFQNLDLDIASASDLQQAQPLRKQAMFKNMADGRSCEDEDAGAVQSQILRQFRYKSLLSAWTKIDVVAILKFFVSK